MPTKSTFKILCLGDIVGKAGQDVLEMELSKIQDQHSIDFTIANIENSASGFGFNNKTYQSLSKLNIDEFTSGNHVYAKREVMENFDRFKRLVRPLNFPDKHPGKGIRTVEINGIKISIINIIGRVFMQMTNCPFVAIDNILKELDSDIIIVDFHAETTSEKQAMGWYLKDRVTLMFGTHTHVQTSDCRLISDKTAFITDIGMCGAYDSVIGMDKQISINKFIDQLPSRHKPINHPNQFVIGAVVLEFDIIKKKIKQCQNIHNIYINERN